MRRRRTEQTTKRESWEMERKKNGEKNLSYMHSASRNLFSLNVCAFAWWCLMPSLFMLAIRGRGELNLRWCKKKNALRLNKNKKRIEILVFGWQMWHVLRLWYEWVSLYTKGITFLSLLTIAFLVDDLQLFSSVFIHLRYCMYCIYLNKYFMGVQKHWNSNLTKQIYVKRRMKEVEVAFRMHFNLLSSLAYFISHFCQFCSLFLLYQSGLRLSVFI
jgi:hypothetical protein